MQLIRGQHNFYQHLGACYATIGTFDGLHLGHQAVLKQLCQKAQAAGVPSVVILFEPHPQEYFNPEKAPVRLTSLRDKLLRLREFGIDKVVCLRFDKYLGGLSADAFIETILVKALRVEHLVVGDDFHFGADRKGNYALLAAWGQRAGFTVEPTASYLWQGARVSSTWVRMAIAENDFALVEQLLARPYSICGRVHHGDKRGRVMGFPTVNLPISKVMAVQGVYAVQIAGLTNELYYGVANIGVRPTLNGLRRLLEVHIFAYRGECYGSHLEVRFCHRLREEKKFASLVALQAQIAQDVATAKKYFGIQL